MKAALLFVLGACTALGCSGDATELEQASLSIDARDMSGRVGHVGCPSLPLLQGSRSYERFAIDDVLTLLVTAEPEQVNVRIRKDDKDVAQRTYQRSALLREQFAEEVPVPISLDLAKPEGYTITFSGECPP